jgi:hypothetical protein
MVVMAREAWTDERLDDLNKKVDVGFGEMREEFRSVRGEISGVRGEIGSVRGEIGALQRSLIHLFAGLIGTLVVGFGGIITAILTHT